MENCCIDTREREFISRVPNVSTRTLPVGDIWIGLSGEDVRPGGVVIERKTAADLEASVLDGRYREQRTRLLGYCKQTGARPMYIIEGDLNRAYGRFTESTLRKFLNRLQLRYGVAVIESLSLEHTIQLCTILKEQVEADASVFVSEDGSQKEYAQVAHVQKSSNRDDPKMFVALALQICPGVSGAVAIAIVNAFGGTLKGVLEATEQAIADTKMSEKRRVGPAVAKRRYALLHA